MVGKAVDKFMRVLQVATKMDRGGLETMIMNCYRHVDRSQVQFDFLLHRREEGAYDEEIRDLGGHLYYVPRANPLSIHYLRSLDRFFSSHPEYRVVHSHIDCMSALPLRAAKRHGVPVRIAHSHSSFQDKDFKYPLKIFCKSFIRKEATQLLACGKEAGLWMFGTDDFEVIPNAIDVGEFKFDARARNRLRMELGIAPQTFVLGHVGRFLPVKNHEFILSVFREMARERPDSVLVLVGDGPLRADVESAAQSLGISDSVKFLGVRTDVSKLMSAMDLFVLPSIYEGLPLVLVEAQASGLPCLISDRIPSDCDLSSLVNRESLEEGGRKWACEILRMGVRGGSDRARYADRIIDLGFDVSSSVDRVLEIYQSSLKSL